MPSPDQPIAPDRETGTPRTVSSDELFGTETELCIHHKGALYRLRITRQDKLILTK